MIVLLKVNSRIQTYFNSFTLDKQELKNERIQLLADQAHIPFKDENSFDCLVFSKEKFAELIVLECLEQVRDEIQYEYDWKLADAVTK